MLLEQVYKWHHMLWSSLLCLPQSVLSFSPDTCTILGLFKKLLFMGRLATIQLQLIWNPLPYSFLILLPSISRIPAFLIDIPWESSHQYSSMWQRWSCYKKFNIMRPQSFPHVLYFTVKTSLIKPEMLFLCAKYNSMNINTF